MRFWEILNSDTIYITVHKYKFDIVIFDSFLFIIVGVLREKLSKSRIPSSKNVWEKVNNVTSKEVCYLFKNFHLFRK